MKRFRYIPNASLSASKLTHDLRCVLREILENNDRELWRFQDAVRKSTSRECNDGCDGRTGDALKEGLVTDETSNTCEYDLHLEAVIVVEMGLVRGLLVMDMIP